MVEPIIFLGQRLVEAIVKILVVGENNVAADIVELQGYEWLASQLQVIASWLSRDGWEERMN